MKSLIYLGLMAVLAGGAAMAQDPAKTDSDKYHVVMENDRVRVLDYRDKPGDKTTQHAHPDCVIYALSSFKRKLTFPSGDSLIRDFKAGETAWIKAQTHIGENIGKTDTHVLLVELKEPAKVPADSLKQGS